MITQPWNFGKSVGQKKPLSEAQINHLKEFLTNQGGIRELALFTTQLDTMLRSSDILKLKVSDIIDFDGNVRTEINIQQKKTRNPHVVDISDATAKILADYVKGKAESDWLFSGYKDKHLSYETHRTIWKGFCKILGIDLRDYGTHSGRRTRAVMVYKDTKDPKLIMNLLGQKDIKSVTDYLGMDKQDSRDIYREKYLK